MEKLYCIYHITISCYQIDSSVKSKIDSYQLDPIHQNCVSEQDYQVIPHLRSRYFPFSNVCYEKGSFVTNCCKLTKLTKIEVNSTIDKDWIFVSKDGMNEKGDRKYSARSNNAVEELVNLKSSLIQMEQMVDHISSYANQNHDHQTVGKILSDLAQISGSLDKLQYNGVDGVITAELVSGRENARQRRRSLNGHCERVRQRVLDLHRIFEGKR